MTNCFKELKKGQVWREYNTVDYGHIIRWEVIHADRCCAIVRNMATLKEIVCDIASEDTFTFETELMINEKGWGQNVK